MGSRPTACRRSATSRCRRTSRISPTSIRTRRPAGSCRCRSPARAATRTSTPSTRSTRSPARAATRTSNFDTLNIYSWKGNGAAGMGATFDTLMTANGDEPDSVYGLLAQSVRVSGDKLDYRFKPAARGEILRRLARHRGRRRLLAQRPQGQGPSGLRPASPGGRVARTPRATTSSTSASSRTAAATRI